MGTPKSVIIGAGPVGSILCAYLCRAGKPCVLVDLRKELMRKIQENGLQVHFEDGVYTQEVETNTSLEALEDEDIDTVFLCVKSIHPPSKTRLLASQTRLFIFWGPHIYFLLFLETSGAQICVISGVSDFWATNIWFLFLRKRARGGNRTGFLRPAAHEPRPGISPPRITYAPEIRALS